MHTEKRHKLVTAAPGLRREATPSEELLWNALRGRQLGVKFRRQHVIGPFVTDFCCHGRHLVIEIDGPVHDPQTERDEIRQQLLEDHGYTVIRFTAEQVETNLGWVIGSIADSLTPPLPRVGEGAGG